MVKTQEDALVMNRQEVAQETFRLRFEAPRIAKAARAGQFVMAQVREGLDPLLRRPFSFHRIFAQEGVVEILFRVAGRGTRMLSRLPPGARLNLIGPLGNGFSLPRGNASPVFLVAGGIGIAPLFELIAQLVSAPHNAEGSADVRLFYGARTASELISAEAFSGFGSSLSLHLSTDDGSLGYHGFVTRLMESVAAKEHRSPAILYACGPLAMQYHVARWALANDVPAQLSLESLMACGVGACLGCALPARHPSGLSMDHYVHVCKDGPIFSAGSIQWQKIRMQQTQPPIFLYS